MEKTLTQQSAERDADKKRREGDFVSEGQQMHQAFTKVSAAWVKKTLSFEEMLRRGREVQKLMKDVEGLKLSDLVASAGKLLLGTKPVKDLDGQENSDLAEHALRQFGTSIGVPGDYLRRLQGVDSDLFDTNINRALGRAVEVREQYSRALETWRKRTNKSEPRPLRPDFMDREVFLRFRKGPDGYFLRAILSDRYAVINNLPFIETLGDIIPGGRVSHLKYDGDTLRANILVPDSLRRESDSDYGGGISVLNNETGRFKAVTRPFTFRAICMNGNIWGRLEGLAFERRHLGEIDWNEFRKAILTNVQKQIPLVAEHVSKLLALKKVPMTQTEIEQAIVFIGRREGLTQESLRGWYTGFKAELDQAKTASDILSVFGLVNGLTRASQKVEDLSVQDAMEMLSARLIEANHDRLLTAARNAVEPEEAQKVLVGEGS